MDSISSHTMTVDTLAELLKNVSVDFDIWGAVIYGSWAKKMQTCNSDIDILVVAERINPKKHRRGKEIASLKQCLPVCNPIDILLLTPNECISNFKNHNPLFLDIAEDGIILIDKNDFLKKLIYETKEYICQRKLQKLSDGWKVPVLYRQPTFLSKVSNRDFAFAMLTDAERDFDIGVSLITGGYFDKAVYHFQQATEKSIKAVLISLGEFKKTHFVGNVLIAKLQSMRLDDDWKEKLRHIASIAIEIEPEVTWSRYPGIDNDELWLPYEEYTESDAINVKNNSKQVLVISKDFCKWWFKT